MQHSLFSASHKPLILRPYQQAAVDAVYAHLRSRDDNPCVVLPTGAGKTPVIATICRDAVKQWGGRVLILAHVKELLQQSVEKLEMTCPDVPVGLYSAGLGRKDMRQRVIVAGIQSIYRKACDFDPFDLIIVDEAHLIPQSGDGMYRQFLADAKQVNPNLRIIGLTATAFRLDCGEICSDDGFLNHVCYEVGVRELIVQGFLSPLRSKAGTGKIDSSQLHVRAGEFIASEVEDAMDDDEHVKQACAEIVAETVDRKSVLIFASGIRHGTHVCEVLKREHGIECAFVSGETPAAERDAILQRFKDGEIKYLANVNVLTTGFDAPDVDAVVLLRPTLSAGLYYQMVGRGFRFPPGKRDCLVLDYGENVTRHGPVDCLKIKSKGGGKKDGEPPAKECPKCHALIAAGYTVCPECQYQFPGPERTKHEAKASTAGVLSGQVNTEQYKVIDVRYALHKKKNADDLAPRTLRVDYQVSLSQWFSEWICFEHDGFAGNKAAIWWKRRSPDPVPRFIEDAIDAIEGGAIAATKEITVRTVSGDDFPRIVDYVLGERPQPMEDAEVNSQDAYESYEPAPAPEFVLGGGDIPF